jgi:hypothetical protein
MGSRFIVESAARIFQYVISAGEARVIVHPHVLKKLGVDLEMSHKKSIGNPIKVSLNSHNIRINFVQKKIIKK